MKTTKTIQVPKVVTEAVVCNICGTAIPDPEGCGPEYATIAASWGYGSPKDTQQHEAHICEPCYDAKVVPLFTVNHITFHGC